MLKPNIADYLKDGVKLEDVITDVAKFSKAIDSYADFKVTEGNNTYKKTFEDKLRDEIKKELETESKLSAEEILKKEREKLDKQRKDFEDAIKQEKISLTKEKVKVVYEKTGLYTEKEIEAMLKLVNENDTESLTFAQTMADERVAKDKERSEKFIEDTQKGQNPPTNDDGNNKGLSMGEKYAKQITTNKESDLEWS